MPGPRHAADRERLVLALLLDDLATARRDLDRVRHAPNDMAELRVAQGSLLVAMECYVAALDRRGLPIPWKLRDELRLQRRIGDIRRDGRG